MTDIMTVAEPKKPKGTDLSERLMTITQAAEHRGVTPQAIRRAIAEGRLPAYPMGRTFLLRRRDVDAYIPIGRGHKKPQG